ncbi:hypothetical protein AGRO_3631 [Agrobacterium sp. ATCC 31749]|nr:hypothetical protein AGRO_3631 [Agrobacterium sp. ATCC 31749]
MEVAMQSAAKDRQPTPAPRVKSGKILDEKKTA